MNDIGQALAGVAGALAVAAVVVVVVALLGAFLYFLANGGND
jgi:hypothetical protein